MKEFLQTGVFGDIRLGDAPDKIKEFLGEPSGYGGTSRKYHVPRIWQYGDIEFFFSSTNDLSKRHLYGIHGDHINYSKILSGKVKFELDTWIIKGGISVEEIEKELLKSEISFERIDWRIPDETIRLKVGVGVELIFIIEGNQNFLDSFSYFSNEFA